jgi:outer membrane protein OmpU
MKHEGKTMKKVLFATTALVATAGVAAADVTLSGSAQMGVIGGDTISATTGVTTGRSTQFFTDIDVTFTMSGETDNGLSFGASIDLDESDGSNTAAGAAGVGASLAFAGTTQGGETLFISGAFGRLEMGDTDGAFDRAMAEVPAGPGSLDDAHEGAGWNGNGGFDGRYDGQVLRYEYSFGDYRVSVSAEVDDTAVGGGDAVLGLGFDGSLDLGGTSVTFGIGYQTVDGPAAGAADEDTLVGLSLGAGFGDVSVGINYSVMEGNLPTEEITHVALGAAYAVDAWSFGLHYSQYEGGVMAANPTYSVGHEASSVGLSAQYDLGGGAAVRFGYSASDVIRAGGIKSDADRFSLGLNMSF